MSGWVAIVNERAGGGRAKLRAREVLSQLSQRGLLFDVKTTTHAAHGSVLAREAFAKGARKFVAIGGDGTSYEVINGLFPAALQERVTFASLPLGTGNSFLRDFGIDSEGEAVERFVRGQTRPVDVVRARHSAGEIFYINLLSVGFSATVGALTNRRFKPFGAAGYPLAVVSGLVALRAPYFSYRIDSGVSELRAATLLSFSNSRYTGGAMMMAPQADVSDGKLDVVHVAPMGRIELLQTFPKIYKGTHVAHPKVTSKTARRIDFDMHAPVSVMVDGEIVDLQLRSLEVMPGAIEVVA